MPYLAFNLNDGNEFVFDLQEDRLSIGRDSKNDIVIDSSHISSFHAAFHRQPNGDYEIVDLKSSSGTFINGKRVERAQVKGGDRLHFGEFESRFNDRPPKGLAPTDVKPGPISGESMPRSPVRTVPVGHAPPKPDPEASRETVRVVLPGGLPPAQLPAAPSAPPEADGNALREETTRRFSELSATDATLKDASEALKAVEQQRSVLEAQKETIATAILNLTAQHGDQERYLEELNERGTAQYKLLQWLAKREEAAKAGARQTEAAQAEAAEKLAVLGKELSETEGTLQSRKDDLQKTQTLLVEVRSEVHSLTQEKATADAALNDAQARLRQALSEANEAGARATAIHQSGAEAEAALAKLETQRDDVQRTATKLSADNDASAHRARELESLLHNLDESVRIREERLQGLQINVDSEVQRLKTAQDSARTAEVSLAELNTNMETQRKITEASRRQAADFESELESRSRRTNELKAEEERFGQALAARQEDLHKAEKSLSTMQERVKATEHELLNVTLTGSKASTIADALKSLEFLHADMQQAVRNATEQELALQARINTIQETSVREKQRMEQLRKERAEFEAEEQKMQEETRERIHELQRRKQEAQAAAEVARKEQANLEQRCGKLHEAEAIGKKWEAVEKRVRGQLEELEEKHEIMRRGLNTDESTVIMFANDLIKRIDLIDILIQRCAVAGDSTMEHQLRTLRASFEDIMHQHGVTEFEVEAGTEIDLNLRQRIAVVESQPGSARPKVVATFRPGFIYSTAEGLEVVLRKVEVRTASL